MKHKKMIVIGSLLVVGLVTYFVYQYTKPENALNRRLISEETAKSEFYLVTDLFGYNQSTLSLVSSQPKWEYRKYGKTGKPIFPWDYGYDWFSSPGSLSTELKSFSTNKTALEKINSNLRNLGYDANLGQLSLSDWLNSELNVRQKTRQKYYPEELDDSYFMNINYVKTGYKLDIGFSVKDFEVSNADVTISLKYACKGDFHCRK